MPRQTDTRKQQCFDLWRQGKPVNQIIEHIKRKLSPKSIRQWVREWERGKHRTWQPRLQKPAEPRRFEPMTDQELHDYSADSLYYELSMLYETAHRLVHDPDIHSDWIVKNALIESFAVHARSLAIFLYEAKKRPDDVTSEEYVKDVQQWKKARGSIPPDLKTVIERTGKEIAHLTTKRHPPGSRQKAWSPEPIVRAFFEPLRQFAVHAQPDRLDFTVKGFIASLQTPSAASPPAAPAPPAASEGPANITSYTDVSTKTPPASSSRTGGT